MTRIVKTVLAGAAIVVALASPAAAADPSLRSDRFIDALAKADACLCHDGGVLDGMAGVLVFNYTADPNQAGNNVIHIVCGIISCDANNELDNLSFSYCAGPYDVMSKK